MKGRISVGGGTLADVGQRLTRRMSQVQWFSAMLFATMAPTADGVFVAGDELCALALLRADIAKQVILRFLACKPLGFWISADFMIPIVTRPGVVSFRHDNRAVAAEEVVLFAESRRPDHARLTRQPPLDPIQRSLYRSAG